MRRKLALSILVFISVLLMAASGLVLVLEGKAKLQLRPVQDVSDESDSRQSDDEDEESRTPVILPTVTPKGQASPADTPIPTWSGTAVMTQNSKTATPTPTLTVTSTTDTFEPCQIPGGWVPYTIKPGENLFRIGLKFGLTVDHLMKANCLSGIMIKAGSAIYVPPVTPNVTYAPVSTSPPDLIPTGTQTITDGSCSVDGSVISRPRAKTSLSGTVPFFGTASIPGFVFYKLEIRQVSGSEADYITIFTVDTPVSNGILGEIDTAVWPDGGYFIRLTVVNESYNYPERCARQYTFDNH